MYVVLEDHQYLFLVHETCLYETPGNEAEKFNSSTGWKNEYAVHSKNCIVCVTYEDYSLEKLVRFSNENKVDRKREIIFNPYVPLLEIKIQDFKVLLLNFQSTEENSSCFSRE